MNIKSLLFLAMLTASLSCAGVKPEAKAFKLPSGREIKVTAVNRVEFPQSGPALVMNYQTDIAISDKIALRKEVDEIWQVFQKDVEAAKVEAGVIRATRLEGTGLVQNGKGYGFVFVKNADGKWHCTDDDKSRK